MQFDRQAVRNCLSGSDAELGFVDPSLTILGRYLTDQSALKVLHFIDVDFEKIK